MITVVVEFWLLLLYHVHVRCAIHLVVNDYRCLYIDPIHPIFKILVMKDGVDAANYVIQCDQDVKHFQGLLRERNIVNLIPHQLLPREDE